MAQSAGGSELPPTSDVITPATLVADRAMASEKTINDAGAGILSGLLAPLRMPERALEAIADAAGAIREVRSELTAMREQTEPLGELVPLTKDLKALVEPMPPTVERISAQAEPLEEMLPALERLEQAVVGRLEAAQETMKAIERDEARLNEQVERLCREIGELKGTISGLKDDVERITERLPDPSHGPLDKVRDVLSGGGNTPSGDES